MLSSRPTPDEIAAADGADIAARFDTLAEIPLDADTLDGWLADWSALEAAASEAIALAAIAAARDTTDEAAVAAHLRLGGEVGPRLDEQHVRLAGRLAALPEPVAAERTGPDGDLGPVVQHARDRAATIQPGQEVTRHRLAELAADYDRITAAMTAEWDGDRVPLAALATHFDDPDRATRERAWRRWLGPYVAARDDLADLFDEQVRLRGELARSAGFTDYVAFAYRETSRPYGPDAARAFHEAVARHIAPALVRRGERRRRALGVDALRPWDEAVDPTQAGRPPLRPAASTAELLDGIERVLARVDPWAGDRFAQLRAEGLIDVDTREGRAGGGFCLGLGYRRRAMIFATRLNTPDDVTILLHEGGHALHAMAAFETQPLTMTLIPGAEANELVAMAMELLAAPFLGREAGGFYAPEDVRDVEVRLLDRILSLLAWITQVDAFQHRVYTSAADQDRTARDAVWAELTAWFDPAADWSGWPEGRAARWMQQSLIFTLPLYMVEYGIAQLGALGIWRRSRSGADPATAFAALRRMMALGNTRPLPELFAAAGLPFAFDAPVVADLVAAVEERLAELEEAQGVSL